MYSVLLCVVYICIKKMKWMMYFFNVNYQHFYWSVYKFWMSSIINVAELAWSLLLKTWKKCNEI